MKNKLDRLTLGAGVDIPFIPAQVTIHNPSIKEIGLIGEDVFWRGCELLSTSKNLLSFEDKSSLEGVDNFDIVMSIWDNLFDKDINDKVALILMFSLIFPDYEVDVQKNSIRLFNEENEHETFLNKDNFNEFQEIILKMFCLDRKDGDDKQEYNPSGDMSKRIADKLMKGRKKAQQQKSESESGELNILERYISILAVGEKKDKNVLLQYTIYQLFDEFERFQLWFTDDITTRAKMAGATGLDDNENWMGDLYNKS